MIRYDWPSIRGLDHFSHVVMADQMLSHGSYGSYLIYPPGFPAVSAVLSRLSGLPPLALFPVIAPALLVLTALAVHVLAARRGAGDMESWRRPWPDWCCTEPTGVSPTAVTRI